MVINEVLFMDLPGAADPARGHEWVEIHNKGTGQQGLRGWALAGRDGTVLADLPNVGLPSGAYLVVHFTNGTNDVDFSDGRGDWYVSHTGTVLDNDQDEIGLFSGTPAVDTAVDFITWKANDAEPVSPGVTQGYAVGKGIWTEGDFLDITSLQHKPFERTRTVHPGETIGRDKDSSDTDKPVDWDAHGGRDALDNTPHRRNLGTYQIRVAPPPPPPNPVEWTFMVYMNGDNNLEPAAFDDLTEMEQTVNSTDVNVVIMVDGFSSITEVEQDGGDWVPVPGRPSGSTWRGQIQHDTDPSLVYLYPAPPDASGGYYLGERNLGDPAELAAFVTWAQVNYPASKYALVIWNHGLGWKGVSYDDTSSGDALRMGELATALAGVKVDLIGYDACLMAMIEVAQQSAGAANVFVASEEVESFDGWPYDTLLADLKASPTMTAAELGKVIVTRYADHYSTVSPVSSYTLSAVDLGAGLSALLDEVSAFGVEMATGVEDIDEQLDPLDNEQIDIQGARDQAEDYREPDYIDLSHFAELVEASPLRDAYKTNAQPIVDRLVVGAGVIITESHGANHPNSHGLSIYYPRFQTKDSGQAGCVGGGCGDPIAAGDPFDEPNTERDTAGSPRVIYAEDLTDENGAVPYVGAPPHPHPEAPGFLFPAGSNWDEFLHRYYKPAADAGPGGSYLWGSLVELDGSGSSDSDGAVTRWLWDLHSTRDEAPTLGGAACLATNEDAECDLRDETDDDPEQEGRSIRFTCNEPEFEVTLSVHDDHAVEHRDHWKTDMSTVTVQCVPCIKATEEAFVIPGQVFTWTIDIVNPTDAFTEVVLTDTLPLGLTMVEARAEVLDFEVASNAVTFFGSLAPGESQRVEIDVKLDDTYTDSEIVNQAEYNYGQAEVAICESVLTVR